MCQGIGGRKDCRQAGLPEDRPEVQALVRTGNTTATASTATAVVSRKRRSRSRPMPSRARSMLGATTSPSPAAVTGSPTVILESGGGASARSLVPDRSRYFARTTRVCSYDRAGLGVSDASSASRVLVPAAKSRRGAPQRCWRGLDSRHRTCWGAGPWAGSSIACTPKRFPAEVVGLVRHRWNAKSVFPAIHLLNPPGFPPIDLAGGPGSPRLVLSDGRRCGASGVVGSGNAPIPSC